MSSASKKKSRRLPIIFAIIASIFVIIVAFFKWGPCILCSLGFTGWCNGPIMYQWVSAGKDDCIGGDIDCSPTATPIDSKCSEQTINKTAICWSNRTQGYPKGDFASNCINKATWCTYKTVDGEKCTGGKAKGQKYICKKIYTCR